MLAWRVEEVQKRCRSSGETSGGGCNGLGQLYSWTGRVWLLWRLTSEEFSNLQPARMGQLWRRTVGPAVLTNCHCSCRRVEYEGEVDGEGKELLSSPKFSQVQETNAVSFSLDPNQHSRVTPPST